MLNPLIREVNKLNELIEFRKYLHSHPEIANNEENTAITVKEFIQKYSPDKIIESIGGNGIAFIFEGETEGPTVLIRAELDALPIIEVNDFAYRSTQKGVSHKCGHDGHMTILAGVAHELQKFKPNKGRVILLFQPAEETGEGAERIINDPKFNSIKPDYAFALHNLPGFNKHEIIIRENTFAAASIGMTTKLYGKTSHAGHPENGISPAIAVSEIIKQFNNILKHGKTSDLDFGLVTVVHTLIGEKAFGTSPGTAEISVTLRTNSNDDLELLKTVCSEIVEKISHNENLKHEINWTEYFPATINHLTAVEIIEKSARELNLTVNKIEVPFRWTEDFGHFSKVTKSALFCLGAGKNTPQLHNPDYDFPDELLPTGIKLFIKIINTICSDN